MALLLLLPLLPVMLATAPPNSGLRFASSFGNAMVLQRGPSRAKIWGFLEVCDACSEHQEEGLAVTAVTAAAARVQVRLSGCAADATAMGEVMQNGTWAAHLPPLNATKPGESCELSATVVATTTDTAAAAESVITTTTTTTLRDVLVGDVWLCSGQSNMVFGTSMATHGKRFVDDANTRGDSVRLFGMGKCQSFLPCLEPAAMSPGWTRASNVSVGQGWGHFSAVCYIYGLQIHTNTGVPIGLIEADVGGVAIHTLAPPNALAKCGVPPLNASQEHSMWKTECSGFDGGVVTPKTICCTDPPNFVVPPTPRASAQSVLWHAMLLPWTRTVITGAIWFQGVSPTFQTTSFGTNWYY